ncbi:MAG: endonuclease/exonuclease/phosphatase family protein [Treponema sp.]|nr:endonuclease/exonuclease/phosphatase family protein [Treponema sp.]
MGLALLVALVLTGCVSGDGLRARDDSLVIMTWNMHLLFDLVEEGTSFRDFQASAGWTREKYMGRIGAISRAIGDMERPPDVIAFQEIGSAQVIADLAEALTRHGYLWGHFANAPGAALGLGLLSRYPLEWVMAHAIDIAGDAIPRPILEARIRLPGGPEGEMDDGASLALFVCHWKSKLGGADETESTRMAAARVILRRMRELALSNPELPLVVVGDMNIPYNEFFVAGATMMRSLMPDDPLAYNFALSRASARLGTNIAQEIAPEQLQMDFLVLSHAKPPEASFFPEGILALYSPWSVEKDGGSYYFRNSWETIDHFLLSAHLFGGAPWEFHDSAALGAPPFAGADGLPMPYNPRTGRGLSDHLPLLLFLRLRV